MILWLVLVDFSGWVMMLVLLRMLVLSVILGSIVRLRLLFIICISVCRLVLIIVVLVCSLGWL